MCHIDQKPTLAVGVDAHDGSGGHHDKNVDNHRDYRSHTGVPYLGLVSKKRLVNVHNTTGSTQHEWCIMVQEPPAANVPEILVCLDCGVLFDFGLLGRISNWILTSPPVHQYHPLLQCQVGHSKEGPIPKPC